MVKYSSPVLSQASSTSSIPLAITPKTRVYGKIVFQNSVVANTVKFISHGNVKQTITVNTQSYIVFRNIDYDTIQLSDSNSYQVYVTLYYATYSEGEDPSAVPATVEYETISTATVNVAGTIDADIVNPLDANGNLKVDLEVDSTGNLGLLTRELTSILMYTNTALGSNATYTTSFENRYWGTSLNGTVKAFAISDQAYTLYIDYSIDGSTVDYSVEAPSAAINSPYVAGAYGSQFAKIVDEFVDQYYRMRIVNGSTAQTYLRAGTIEENS